jgi:hypothetical protein
MAPPKRERPKHKRVRESEFPKMNPIRQVQKIENYRGYKIILYLPIITGDSMTHFGYLDRDFFAFKLRKKSRTDKTSFLFDTPHMAIDYYLDKMYFKNSQMEWDGFANINEYKTLVTALKFVYDSLYKTNV